MFNSWLELKTEWELFLAAGNYYSNKFRDFICLYT